MNARVDPAVLAPAVSGGDDTRLIALCRAAIRTVDLDLECTLLWERVQEQFDARKAVYPMTGWRSGKHDSSRQLRLCLKTHGAGANPSWKRAIRTQIAAVAEWERACKALKNEMGIDKIYRQRKRAVALSSKHVKDVASTPAVTLIGAAWKATVSAHWITAGCSHAADAGEALVLSILNDVRMLGAGGTDDGKIQRRKAG